jgi:hypothetical protein
MDYTKQAEDMIKMWTDAQKRAWDTMLSASKGLGGSQAGEMWEKSMQALEESIKKALEMQAQWTKMWAEQLSSANAPEGLREWAGQARDMMKTLADTQARLWSEWIRVVSKLNSAKTGGGWETDVESFMRKWQEVADKALEAQRDWAKRWTETLSRKKKSTERTAKP